MKILQAHLIRYPYFTQSFLEKKTMTKVLRQQTQYYRQFMPIADQVLKPTILCMQPPEDWNNLVGE